MGCDIHLYAERRTPSGGYEALLAPRIMHVRSYARFAFLAGVRNYSAVKPIAEPRGMPADVGELVKEELGRWSTDAHTPSWLSIAELVAFDYDAIVEDRRVLREVRSNLYSGACTAIAGEGTHTTWRAFLGADFIDCIKAMDAAGIDRIVFWFDN